MPQRKKSKQGSEGDSTETSDTSSRQNVIGTRPVNLQEESQLMRLPLELRNKIYSNVFSSTRFIIEEKFVSPTGILRMASAPHGLALLLSCRKANAEIGSTWLSQVLFCFESAEVMLDRLTCISPETLSLIKHVLVIGHPLVISTINRNSIYTAAELLALLPGLKLDRLTVLGPQNIGISHDTVDILVKHSCGWKELNYISQSSGFITREHKRVPSEHGPEGDRYLTVVQPESWQQNLEARDGSDSGAAVTIYQSTKPDHPGSVLHAATRVKYSQSLPPEQGATGSERVEEFRLGDPRICAKEALVVVNRGRDVDYEEKHGSHVEHHHIRSQFPGKTWLQIKTEQWGMFHLTDFSSYKDSKNQAWYKALIETEENEVPVDGHSHVGDYVWPHNPPPPFSLTDLALGLDEIYSLEYPPRTLGQCSSCCY
ncbi:hypothetical protein TARUN_3902 [Trichoderma arundinaceum]|uniref:Uncharacterized protein n=1 Tax=Trichoderma arundinaceum TaxID=490622 RepID=A0A395NQM0_TRIAR|nr:hypothetical protein TARUN_3902 [Trichoderma arundinaceum]